MDASAVHKNPYTLEVKTRKYANSSNGIETVESVDCNLLPTLHSRSRLYRKGIIFTKMVNDLKTIHLNYSIIYFFKKETVIYAV